MKPLPNDTERSFLAAVALFRDGPATEEELRDAARLRERERAIPLAAKRAA